jgi:hypothetical protein
MIGVLILALLPLAAWAQFDESGNFTVEERLGVGTESPVRAVHLSGANAVFRMDRDRNAAAFQLVRTPSGNLNSVLKSYSVGVNASAVNNGEFFVNDNGTATSGTGTRRLTIANNGQAGIGTFTAPLAGLHVLNPVAGDIFRLDTVAGTEVFEVSDDGNLYAFGSDLELRLASTTSDGYNLGLTSTLLVNKTDGTDEEAFLALNGDTAVICSPGEGGRGLLQIQDSFNNWTNYQFNNEGIVIGHMGDITISAPKLGDAQELILSTTGEEIQFVADSNAGTGQNQAFTWFNNGMSTGDKLMDLWSTGALRVKGAVTPNHAFDLAEAYWKGEAPIEAGDVVCISPERPDAVVLASTANDRTAVGVVSSDPGLVMGGGAFSAEHLEELWGEEIAAEFAAERAAILEKLGSEDAYLKNRRAVAAKMKAGLSKARRRDEVIAARAEYEREQQQLAATQEDAALKAFCEARLVSVALAGRVPVKVDASFGAIQAGDALVASSTPGHAMRSDNPAPLTVIGKALENFDSGRGSIMMLVLNR